MNNGQCKYLFLVGGLSQSPYFQQRMIEYAAGSMTIITPSSPILSVVQGAARWGIVPNFVLSRRLTKSYGIRTEEKMNKIDKWGLSADYIKSHTKSMHGGEYVTGLLDVFAEKNSEIKLNCKFENTYYRHSKERKTVKVQVYECDKDEIPKSVEDKGVVVMGSFELKFPENSDRLDIKVEYSFHDTILVVTAIWEDKRKRVHIKHSDALKQRTKKIKG